MARVEISQIRLQDAHFGLYRTSAGGDESIIVRRKVGEPTDYQHISSRKVARYREYLTQASQHWARLTPTQKAIWRQKIAIVDRIRPRSPSEEVLLKGRQLFIHEEIRSLSTKHQHIQLPMELCIVLTDEFYNPLDGVLELHYLENGEWHNVESEQLTTGNWLFSQTPKGKEAYRPYGEAENYYDPQLPEHQFMSESQIKAYHYHVLLSALTTICHSIPTGITAIDTTHSYRFSQPFKPCNPFDLKELLISLRRHQDPSYPPLSTGFIAIHHATEARKPIEPPLRQASFNISVPSYPEWGKHKVTFEPLALEADQLYTWVIGFPYQSPENGRVQIEQGENGACNLDPITPTYMSRWSDGYWGDWNTFATPQCYYEMKA